MFHVKHVALAALALLFLVGCSEQDIADVFDLGDGIECKIIAKNECEPSLFYYYTVIRNGRQLVPETYFDLYGLDEEPEFELLASKDRRLFGLVNKKEPNSLLMLFDKQELNSWPRSLPKERHEDTRKRGRKLLLDLRRALNNEALELAGEKSSTN